ncbi:MAG: thioredoxin-dependent thiol peroxidase [Deltaproteobacteria bacterium]|nr:thioredoxin-dependent thiol peroxidase [Deltaproteobacteria bacterium]
MSELAVGDIAPDFTLPSDTDGDVTLSSYRGRKVVLYFYPKDSTPGCTTQACDFRDRAAALAAKDAVVLGVSKDSLASHERFRAKHELNFPLLSDPDLDVHKAFDAYGEKTMYGKKRMGVKRTTVVIDEEGIVTFIKHNVRSKGSVDRAIDQL